MRSECRVKVGRSVAEVEALRPVWTSMLRDGVQTDLDYFLWSLEEEPHVVRPHVLEVERDGETVAILVARVLDIDLPCRVGYTTVYAPNVRAICAVRDGLLGRADPDVAAAILDELMSAFDRHEADALLFRQLQVGGVLQRAARDRSSFATWQHASPSDLRWQIELPASLEEYVKTLSPSGRKGMRQTANRLERQFGDRLSVRIFDTPADLDTFVRDAEIVALETYQRRLGVGFQEDQEQQKRTRLLMDRGWFRGYILYLDGTPIAFEQGEVYRGRFHSLSAGYNPAFKQHRVGAYLLMKAIEELARNPEASVFDFGFGDADYKRRLGSRSVEEADAIIYSRRLRPLWINLARSVLLQTSSTTKAGLHRLGFLDSSKRWWLRSRGSPRLRKTGTREGGFRSRENP